LQLDELGKTADEADKKPAIQGIIYVIISRFNGTSSSFILFNTHSVLDKENMANILAQKSVSRRN